MEGPWPCALPIANLVQLLKKVLEEEKNIYKNNYSLHSFQQVQGSRIAYCIRCRRSRTNITSPRFISPNISIALLPFCAPLRPPFPPAGAQPPPLLLPEGGCCCRINEVKIKPTSLDVAAVCLALQIRKLVTVQGKMKPVSRCYYCRWVLDITNAYQTQ